MFSYVLTEGFMNQISAGLVKSFTVMKKKNDTFVLRIQ